MMLARNEGWCLEFALRAALSWCDSVVLHLDRCSDGSPALAARLSAEFPGRLSVAAVSPPPGSVWPEMDMREALLREAASLGPSHFALIDADEALAADLLPGARDAVAALPEGCYLAPRMLSPWGMEFSGRFPGWPVRCDGPFASPVMAVAVAASPGLTYRPAVDGYQHHHRLPYGRDFAPWAPPAWASSGCWHLQYGSEFRLAAKALWYKLGELLRWPGRMSAAELNRKYDWALPSSTPGGFSSVVGSPAWSAYLFPVDIRWDDLPWHLAECAGMLRDRPGLFVSGLADHGLFAWLVRRYPDLAPLAASVGFSLLSPPEASRVT